jgi:hypothetical protein
MIKNWQEFLNSVPTEELEKEIERRNSKGKDSDIWTVVSFWGFEGPNYDRRGKHIIENESGDRKKVDLTNVSDSHLSEMQPQMSDEEDGYEDSWEEYEEYQRNYLIGKKVKEINNNGYIYYSLV